MKPAIKPKEIRLIQSVAGNLLVSLIFMCMITMLLVRPCLE
jgi:hypothetical protein